MNKALQTLCFFLFCVSVSAQSSKKEYFLTFDVDEVCSLIGNNVATVNKFIISKGYALESQTVEFNIPMLNYQLPGSAFKMAVSTKNGKVEAIFWREGVDEIGFFISHALVRYGFKSRGGWMVNDEKQISLIANLRELDNAGLVIVGAINKAVK